MQASCHDRTAVSSVKTRQRGVARRKGLIKTSSTIV